MFEVVILQFFSSFTSFKILKEKESLDKYNKELAQETYICFSLLIFFDDDKYFSGK